MGNVPISERIKNLCYNKNMEKRKRLGFTLIEVSLFLAVTGLLFVGIALGTQNSINQQRSYDSIQSFAEFLRSIYSEVANPQSIGDGRSEQAIYGKIVTFGESKNLLDESNAKKEIFAYDVVGNVDSDFSTSNILDQLVAAKANVVVAGSDGNAVRAGIIEEYTLKWQAKLEGIENNTDFKGTLLIVRHPRSGTINTLYRTGAIAVNSLITQGKSVEDIGTTFRNQLKTGTNGFNAVDVDFCINATGDRDNNKRTDVRIVKNAHNASGIEIIGLDDNSATGNRCRKW